MRAVNAQRDEKGIKFCEEGNDCQGYRRPLARSQLSKELQMIVQKYSEHFASTSVPDSAGAASEIREVTSDYHTS